MENASNALIIAGTILIGVMIISVGIYLVNSFGDTSQQINSKIEDTKIAEFNYSFTKYEGLEKIKAHDIVSVANLAKDNNENKYGEKLEKTGINASPYYIQVIITKTSGEFADPIKSVASKFEKAEKKIYDEFLKDYSINVITPYYFKCTDVHINETTGLVDKIEFEL